MLSSFIPLLISLFKNSLSTDDLPLLRISVITLINGWSVKTSMCCKYASLIIILFLVIGTNTINILISL